MSRIHIPAALRQLVLERARGRCEYCLLDQNDVAFSHHVDHIIPLKHGGRTEEGNLALACLECNLNKGSDLASLDPQGRVLVPVFNPRAHRWEEHFARQGTRIEGKTPIGRAAVALLKLNDPARVLQRQVLIDIGRYPSRES